MSQTFDAEAHKKATDTKPAPTPTTLQESDELADPLEDNELALDDIHGASAVGETVSGTGSALPKDPSAGKGIGAAPIGGNGQQANAPVDPQARRRQRRNAMTEEELAPMVRGLRQAPRLERRQRMGPEVLGPLAEKARLGFLGIPDTDDPSKKPMVLPGRAMKAKIDKVDVTTDVAGENSGDAIVLGTPKSLPEVAAMQAEDIAKYPGAAGSAWPPGPQARPIMMKAFGSNWFYAKDVLIGGNWPEAIRAKNPSLVKTPALATELMWKLLALRTYEYDGILHLLRERYMPKYAADPTVKKPDDVLKWGSAGSVTITSDIDVNLGGKENMQAVGDFNAEFKKRGWPYEAGTVFDVNVYCKDNMHGFGFTKGEGGAAIMDVATEANMPGNIATEEKDADQQEVAAMIKLLRFMTNGGDYKTNGDWAKYKAGVIGDGEGPENKATKKKVAEAELRYDKWRFDLWQAKQLLLRSGEVAVDTLAAIDPDEGGKKAAAALDMQASNRLYEIKIERLKSLRAQLAVLAAADQKDHALIRSTAIELRQVILEAGMFANEAMVTAGASNFVVFGTQVGAKSDTLADASKGIKEKTGEDVKVGKVQIRLTEAQFYHAFTEQLADTLKEFHHFETLDEGLWKGGKYLMRMTLAADQLDGVKEANVENYEKLRTLGDYAMTAKNMNGTMPDILAVLWKAIQKEFPSFHDKAHDLHEFTGIVVKFGVDVAAAYKAKKKSLPTPQPSPKTQVKETDEANERQYQEALAAKTGAKLKIAEVAGANLTEAIEALSEGKVTRKV